MKLTTHRRAPLTHAVIAQEPHPRRRFLMYVRNAVFGIEDGLVSTVGLLAGIAAGGIERKAIIITGIVLIFVEALSMAVGSILTEHSVEGLEHQRVVPLHRVVMGGVIMFVSYLGAGILPLLPYIWATPIVALVVSVIIALIVLVLLGVFTAPRSPDGSWRPAIYHALEMCILGGAAVAVGILVGWATKGI